MRFSRVAVVSAKAAKVAGLLEEHGFSVVSRRPDFVVAFGGDGTILASEHLYPGVPKLGVRNSERCRLCQFRFVGKHATELVCWSCLEHGLNILERGDFDVVRKDKAEAVFGRIRLSGLNEVQLHNADPRRAVRFSIYAEGKAIVQDAIGDGAVLATAFGAGGYFRSVSRQTFERGFGLALNNPVLTRGPWFFTEKMPSILIEVDRGPAWVLADNAARKLIVPSGGKVLFRRSLQSARFVGLR